MKSLKKSNAKNKISRRRLLVETLETRRLLSADWRNPVNSIDVNRDQMVTPLDALVVINEVARRNRAGITELEPRPLNSTLPFYDVDGNAEIVPLDALRVINGIRPLTRSEYVLTESSAAASELSVTIGLGGLEGTRTYQFDVDASFDFDSQSSLQDALAVYLVDPATPQNTLLDRGEAGTAIFVLSGQKADFVPGMVRFDGQTVSVDLTELGNLDTGKLVFQLISQNDQSGTSITIRPHSNDVNTSGVLPVRMTSNDQLSALGDSIDLAALASAADGHFDVELRNVRFDRTTGRYDAELQVINRGESVGRDLAIAFPGLPEGAVLEGAAGQTTDGHPLLSLRPAIAAGGLGRGQRSAPVRVSITTQDLQRFHLATVVYVGQPNRAPGLPSLTPITITPGARMDVELGATDPDGDRVTYALQGANGLSMRLSVNGILSLLPTPDQIGTHSLTVIASDGILSSQQLLEINVVADPVVTTRISGQVLDVDGTTLQGLQVEVGGVQGLTLADGRFTLDLGSGPIVADTLRVRGETFAGAASYPFIAEKLPFMLGREIYQGFNNIIHRPIYLPKLDVAGGTTVDPMQDTMVQQEVAPGEFAEVFVAAGTLMNQQGTPFTGTLSITEVPADLTPAALPSTLMPDIVVTVQPGEMVFASPAPMSFPNRSGWAPGTLMDLWSINPVTGEFDDVGDMRVSVDGQTIDTISGGVRNSSWHTPVPRPEAPKDNKRTEENSCNECPKKGVNANSTIELHSGTLLEWHSLVGYESLGTSRSWVLTYDSLRADPRPIVHFSYTFAQPGQSLWASLQFLETQPFFELGSSSSFATRAFDAPGSQFIEFGAAAANVWSIPPDFVGSPGAALQGDLRNANTGIIDYRVTSGLMRLNENGLPVGASSLAVGRVLNVNSINSPFGSGWGLAGLHELYIHPQSRDVLLVDGDGGEMLFGAPVSDEMPYTSPPGDFSELRMLEDGTFQRTMKDRTVYEFNSDHQLALMRDRHGNETRFEYRDRIIRKIIDPVGLETLFAHENGKVNQITDPAGRVTRLQFDDAGNLLRVIDPDGSSRTWDYDQHHLMTGETDQRGNHEETIYDFAGRVSRAIRKDGTELTIGTVQVQGLYPPDLTDDVLNIATAPPVVASGDAVATVVDANGNVTRSDLDQAGQSVSETDSGGRLPSVERNGQNRVVRSEDGRGFTTDYTYDERGNLLSVLDEAAGAISEPGEVDEFTFEAVANDRFFYFGSDADGEPILAELFSPSGALLFSIRSDLSSSQNLIEPGTYKLRLRSSAGAVGDYLFRGYVSHQRMADLELGEIVAGQLLTPGEQHVFTLAGVAGQRLLVDGLEPNSPLEYTLHSPSGHNLTSGCFGIFSCFASWTVPDNYGPLVLTESGNYTLTVIGSGETVGAYRLRVLAPATSEYVLELDQLVQGNIAGFEDRQVYSFAATAGQRIFYDAHDEDFDAISAILYSPSGATVFSINSDSDFTDSIVLNETGEFLLVLAGSGETLGDFQFTLHDVTFAQLPLTLDNPAAGTIQQPGDQVEYTFMATAGQRLLYQAAEVDADAINVILRSPSAATVFHLDSNTVDVDPYTLSENGEYRLTLYISGSATGDFSFVLSSPPTATQALTLGQATENMLPGAGDEIVYEFPASIGQMLMFEELDDDGDAIHRQLLAPGGGSVAFTDRVPLVVTETGTYRLITKNRTLEPIDDRFRLHSVSDAPEVIAGQTANVQLMPDAPLALLRVKMQAGQVLQFDPLTDQINGSWGLLSPINQYLSGNVLAGGFSVRAETTGEHVLYLAGSELVESVEFSFQVTDTSEPAVTADGLGVVREGMLNPGETITFNYTIPAGSSTVFDSLDPTGANLLVDLVRADDAVLVTFAAGSDYWPFFVPEPGDYRLVVRGSSPEDSGSFRFNYSAPLLNAQPYNVGDTLTDSIAPYETKVYQFAVTAGSRIFYDALEADYDPISIYVAAPLGGYWIAQNTDDDAGPFTFVEAGKYTIYITGSEEAAGDFSFRFVAPVNEHRPLAIGDLTTGDLTVPGDQHTYAFQGQAGQRLYYDAIDADFDAINTSLTSPSGIQLWFTNSDFDAGPIVLTESGTYWLSFYGSGDTIGTYQFQLQDVTPIFSELVFDTETTGDFSSIRELHGFTFMGVAGDFIYYDALEDDRDEVYVSLISPSGITVVGQNSDFDFGPVKLPESGEYHLIQERYTEADADYRFRLRHATYDRKPLTIGQPVSGQITELGEQHVYEFTATAGQQFFFDTLDDDTEPLSISLVSPTGVQALGISGNRETFPFMLTESGPFHFIVSGIGDYEFRLLPADVTSKPIAIGDNVSGEILVPGGQVVFVFQGQIGQRIDFDWLDSDSDPMTATLNSPFGATVFSTVSSTFNRTLDAEATLPATGEYRLTLGLSQVATGDYEFRLLDLTQSQRIGFSEDVVLEVDSSSQRDTYLFEGRAGQRVRVEFQDGNVLGQWSIVQSPLTLSPVFLDTDSVREDLEAILPANGTYAIKLGSLTRRSGTDPLQQHFQIRAYQTNTQAIALGQEVTGSVASDLTTEEFTFTGVPGQTVFIDTYDSTALFSLATPSGTEIPLESTSQVVRLSGAGTYRVLVRQRFSPTGDFRLRVLDLATVPQLPLNTSVALTPSDPTESFILRVEANAGDEITIITQALPGEGFWSLLTPGGTTLDFVDRSGAADRISELSAIAPATGTYYLRTKPVEPFEFSAEVIRNARLSSQTVAVVREGLLNNGQSVTFDYALFAGTPIFFDNLVIGDSSFSYTMRSPSGDVVFQRGGGQDSGPFFIEENGQHTLQVQRSGTFGLPNYKFSMLDGNLAIRRAMGQQISGRLMPGRTAELFVFEAFTGQRLLADLLSTSSSSVKLRIFDPQWRELPDPMTAPVVVDQRGLYRVLVEATTDDTVNFSFALRDLTALTPLSTGEMNVGTLGEFPDTIAFALTGRAGERIYFDTDATGFGSPTRTLFGPDGERITISSTFGSFTDFEVTLPRDGRYYLFITKFDTPAATVNFAVYNPLTVSAALASLQTSGGLRTYTYEPNFNRMTSVTDELGHQSLYEIDPVTGNLLSAARVMGQPDAVSGETNDLVSRYTYTARGQIDTMTDPLGRISDYDYDALGRLTQVIVALGTADEATMRYEYDEQTVAGRAGLVTASIDERGSRTQFEYDVLNRLIRTIEPDPDGDAGQLPSPVWEMVYDAAGNVVQSIDARGQVSRFEYDERGRQVRVIQSDPDGNGPLVAPETTFVYDVNGNLTTVTDPLGNVTRHTYDVRNRRLATTDPDGGITRFRYDTDGNLIALTDPVQNTTRFVYDHRNQLIREIDPVGKPIVYQYDAAGRLTSKIDRNQRRTNFEYDEADRLTKEVWVGGDNTLEYQYDLASNLLHTKDAFSELTYTYDARNRMLTTDNAGTPNAPQVLLTYVYDAIGNVTSVTDIIDLDGPGEEHTPQPGATTGYVYDALNRLGTLTQSAATGATGSTSVPLPSDKRVDFTYNPLGQYENIRRYKTLSAADVDLVIDTEYAYDSLNRLASIDHRNQANEAVSFFHYKYDDASRITQITDIDGVTDYGYDDRSQLTAANHTDPSNPDELYRYDANGNRLESHLHGTGYVTGPANRLLSDGTYNYQYDDEGNTILRHEITTGNYREFHWDHRNRLIAVIDNLADGTATQEIRFTYDILNRRQSTVRDKIDITVSTTQREFLIFDHFSEYRIISYPDDSDIANSIFLLNGQLFGQAYAREHVGRESLWSIWNHQVTTSLEVTSDGTVSKQLNTSSFGLPEQSVMNFESAAFQGHRYLDNELVFARGRYIDVANGRFLSEDIYIEGASSYRVDINNPVSYVDILGMSPSMSCETAPRGPWTPVGDSNCYNYALGFPYNAPITPGSPRAPYFWQPGGNVVYSTCRSLTLRIEMDALKYGFDIKSPNASGGCECGYHKIRIWSSESPFEVQNFHFYRYDVGLGWSHKEGKSRPQPVLDPNNYHALGHDYKNCGDLCIK